MNLTETVASTVAELTFDQLPPDIIEKTKLLLLDQMGCTLAGSTSTYAQQLTCYLRSIDGGGESSVFGTGERFGVANAAHANGHAQTILSLDDSFVRYGHPGNSVIPAALATAEALDADGRDLITAVVAGYEMSMRLGVAIKATAERDEAVKGNATWQIYGATTACAKLHDLTAEEIASAFGLAAIHAPLPFVRKFYSKPINRLKNNYGWACKGGVTAVELTRAGFDGNRSIFDGDNGFWVMAGSDQFAPDALLSNFPDRSFVREIGFKPYGVCRWIHTTIDCVRDLIRDSDLSHDNFDEMTIRTAGEFIKDLNGPWPKSTIDAIVHINYAVVLELHGKTSALGVREEDLTDSALPQTARRIVLETMPGADELFYKNSRLPVEVIVRFKDGRVESRYAELPKGHPEGPEFGADEVAAKFHSLADPVVGRGVAESLCERILELETHTFRAVVRENDWPTTRPALQEGA